MTTSNPNFPLKGSLFKHHQCMKLEVQPPAWELWGTLLKYDRLPSCSCLLSTQQRSEQVLRPCSWPYHPFAEDNTYTTHRTWGYKAGAYLEPSSLCASIFGTERYCVDYQKINGNTKPATKSLNYNGVLPARFVRAMVAQSL